MMSEKEQTMELLFHSYYTPLYLYALNILEDEEEAKDVVSNVFALIWQMNLRNSSIEKPKVSFLYTLVKNNCISLLRHNKVKENYSYLAEHSDRIENEEDVAEYEQRVQAMNRLIEQLPEPDKSILLCCYFKRMTYQETADKLKLTLVVVKKKMLKVFKFLREGLRKDEKEV